MKNKSQIIRSDKTGKSNYTPLMNEILQSKILTCEQKSILVHLLSLPKDWSIYKTTLWKEMNIGRDRFYKGWKGLVEMGYIVENKIYGKNRKVEGYSYIIYEEPRKSDSPKTSQPENNIQETIISGIPEFELTEIMVDQEPECIQKNNITKDISTNNTSTKDIIKEIITNIDINTSSNIGPIILGEIEKFGNIKKEQIPLLQDLYLKLNSRILNSKNIIEQSFQTGKKLFSEILSNKIRKVENIHRISNMIRPEYFEKLQEMMDEYWLHQEQFIICKNIMDRKMAECNYFSTEEEY